MEIGISKKFDNLESEIVSLKLLLLKLIQNKKQKSLRLEGSLEGISVSEEDIKEAKNSLFNE